MDSNFIRLKKELAITTNSRGWTYVKQIADNVVNAAKQAAIDEEDPIRGEILRRKAKAMQDGLRDLFAAIEASTQFSDEPEPDWFANLGFDTAELQELS